MSSESVSVKALAAEVLSITYTTIAASASRGVELDQVGLEEPLLANQLADELVANTDFGEHSDQHSADGESGDEDDNASVSDSDDAASSASEVMSLEDDVASEDDSNADQGDETDSDASDSDDSVDQESDSEEENVADSIDTAAESSNQGAQKPQQILKEKLEKSLKQLQQKSEEVDRAATTYLKKQEELLIESHKSMSESLHRSSKEVQQNCGGLVGQMTESMQKGLDIAKTKSDSHSARMSKGFAYAEKKAKGVADSTRDKVSTFFRKQPFRFGA